MLTRFLAALTLAGASLYAHSPALLITVPVIAGGDYRAACEDASAAGAWTFTVTAVSGNNISKVNVQVYSNAGPSQVDGEPRVCASYTGTGVDAQGRTQAICPNMTVGTVQKDGAVTIIKPQVGNTGSLSLPAGARCVRPLVNGSGSVTISVTHP